MDEAKRGAAARSEGVGGQGPDGEPGQGGLIDPRTAHIAPLDPLEYPPDVYPEPAPCRFPCIMVSITPTGFDVQTQDLDGGAC